MELYQGQNIELRLDKERIAWLDIGKANAGLTVLSDALLAELEQVAHLLEKEILIKGLVLFNSQSPFCVGADVKGFLPKFHWPAERLQRWCTDVHRLFARFERLPFPSVSLISGRALGGGIELVLATHYRIADPATLLALPEVKLGIFPGWGGTVRLPRLIGLDNALEWILTGKEWTAIQALQQGFLDAIVPFEQQAQAATELLQRIHADALDWPQRVRQKNQALPLDSLEARLSLTLARGQILATVGKHYPAPLAALSLIQDSMRLTGAQAAELEVKLFVEQAQGPVASALVSIFLNDTRLKADARQAAKQVTPTEVLGVVGAGIMGAGIAQQAASRGIQALLNDLSVEALTRAQQQIHQQQLSRLERGRITPQALAETLSRLSLSPDLNRLNQANWLIEAVVERQDIKGPLLARLEALQPADSWLATNTSTLSIAQLATGLQRPERFCGLHFFNPVSQMPLLEIVRGPQTSDDCIQQAQALANQLGKTPIVVQDCPGFYVNRVLFPYFRAFLQLVQQGVDYRRIDAVMQGYGWPMGPAWLLDVVGLDTAHHAAQVLAQAYPDRMSRLDDDLIQWCYQQGLLGQKTGQGFYLYAGIKEGKKPEQANPALQEHCPPPTAEAELSDAAIIERLMLPLWFEVARCIEQKIIAEPAQVELGLVYGLGYPPFRGGPLLSMAQFGWDRLLAAAATWQSLGAAYQVPEQVQDWARRQWMPLTGAEL